ncbi:MAG: PP2C family protein-serine/threonine phosphatase [Candidatus Acidiferrum sp.]|jgi:phosphoserine phosphatase RsbU/P
MNMIGTPVDLGVIEKLREEELEEARSIQSSMLPTEPLNRGGIRISHEFQPVAEVGGDFLDYFELADGCIGLYLGDVSGKGLPAAMFAALAVGTLRGVHKTGQSPANVLSTLNRRLLLRGASRRHAAMQYAVFDPRTNEMQISSAGMPGPYHISPQGCRVMEIQGIPPGLFDPSVEYETQKITVEPGDSVLFFTDGISDAFSMDGESFGIERLQVVCEAYRDSSPRELLGHVFSEIDLFAQGRTQHDDMAAALFHLETV